MKVNTLKLAIIGPEYIGKTNLCKEMTGQDKASTYIGTIGVDYLHRTIPGTKLTVGLWDLSGAKRFETIIESFARNSDILMFGFSSEDKGSYNLMMELYNRFSDNYFLRKKEIIVIATKTDSSKSYEGYKEDGSLAATKMSCKFIETSSVTRAGINDIFDICRSHYDRNIDPQNFKLENVDLSDPTLKTPCYIC